MNIDTLSKEAVDDKETFSFIVSSLKRIVSKYDTEATINLFGSRARGDYHDESDWDFLILTNYPEMDTSFKDNIRKEILYEVEFKIQHHIATIFHNKNIWQSDYRVTNLFRSIQEEGIVV